MRTYYDPEDETCEKTDRYERLMDLADVLAENVEHADAVMFAAAPDLLAALRGLMTQAVKDAESYAEDDSEAIWAWIKDAADAIAKATGKGIA